MLRTFTIDLEKAPEHISDKIDQTEEAEQRLLEKVAEKFPEHGFEDEDCPQGYEDKFYEIREQRSELEATRRRIRQFIGEDGEANGGQADWPDYQFTFREPSTADALYVKGRSQKASEEANSRGEAVDGEMFGLTQMLDRLLEESPPGSPDDLAAGLPNKVGQYLLMRLEEETAGGGTDDPGNPTPQEALRNFENSRQG